MKPLDWLLVIFFVLVNGSLVGLSYYNNTYRYVLSLAVEFWFVLLFVIAMSCGAFIYSFRRHTKKYPSILVWVIFLCLLIVHSYNVLGVILLLSKLLSKSIFINGINSFVISYLILSGGLLSYYDFPKSFNLSEYYINCRKYFGSRFTLMVIFAFLSSVIDYFTGSFVFFGAMVIILISTFIGKGLLANVKT